ncbi:MAG: HAD family hydrolase [Bdellovibrionales bacterium]
MAEYRHTTHHLKDLKSLVSSLEEDRRQGRAVLAVFDLDSTLFDVSPRLQKILEDLRDHPELVLRFPETLPLLKNVKTLRSDWGIKSALSRVFSGQPPGHEFHKFAREFWAKSFFTNEYLQYDHPVEGAVDFVNHVHQLGLQIAYLTGRDWGRMGPGTVEVLKKWNFPVPNEQDVRLAMKPVAGSDDSEFKSGWFMNIKPHDYTRLLFFENEPVILHNVMKDHPEIEIFFLETTHSGRAQPHENWHKIPNFLWR